MGVLTTPADELSDEEQVLADHLVLRFRQIDNVFEMLQEQTEKLAESNEIMGEQTAALEQIADEEGQSLNDEVADEIVENARQIGEESLMTKVVAEQALSIYNFYVEVANALEDGQLTPPEAAARTIEIEEEIAWLDEADGDVVELASEADTPDSDDRTDSALEEGADVEESADE